MMHPCSSSGDYFADSHPISRLGSPSVEPLVNSSPSPFFVSRQEKVQRGRNGVRSRCFFYCVALAAVALLSCLYVDKEAVSSLRKRSSSLIRKEVNNVLNTDNQQTFEGRSPANTKDNDGPSGGANPGAGSNGTVSGAGESSLVIAWNYEDKKEETDLEEANIVEVERTSIQVVKYKSNLVLHVGPQKTGSTTLQTVWHTPDGLIEPLKDDNYRYSFINPRAGFFDCNIRNGSYKDCKASNQLKGIIRFARNNGENLLLSDENLDEGFVQPLLEAIDGEYWEVTVIVVYRRIHEWLFSWYNQINKTTNKDKNGNFVLDQIGHPTRIEHTYWPDEGGEKIPTFTDWYKLYTKFWEKSDLVNKHRSIAYMQAYQPFFDNVVVHNMHQEGDLLTNFMCDSVPKATYCCKKLKSGALKIPRENESVNLDHNILAVEAREKGLIPKRFSRQDVVQAVSKFVVTKKKTLPRKCDQEVVDEIRTWLLDSERFMFNESWTDQNTLDLQHLYDSYVKEGRLCDVDLEEVFLDKDWINFFKSFDDRPILVLHIGPQKTGSTTLQLAWNAPKELLDLLHQDHFSYAKITPTKGAFECNIVEDQRYSNCRATKKLVDIIEDASQKRENLLLSDENLDEKYVDSLREVIDDKKFRVRIVVVYRRIHEWLFSWYNQINKSTNMDANGKYLIDENGLLYREDHKYWPDQGGIHIPSFSEWYSEFVQDIKPEKRASEHPTMHFMNVYKPHFKNIQVYNMHQDGDLVTNFMCQMIPEAEMSCNALKEGVDVPLENPSVNLDHDILAVRAYDKGMVSKGLTRPEVVAAVSHFVEQSGKVLPRKCNNETINQIREWLLESEHIVFPDKWSQQTKEDLDQIFDTYCAKGKLCDMDVEKVLADQEWIDFFATLNTNENSVHGLGIEKDSAAVAAHKNHLFLHIGPQKTGSSTLQSTWDIMRSDLEKDNYNYKHITPEDSDFNCRINRWGGFTDCMASEKLKSLIDETRQAGKNLLLTDENLDERFAGPLRDVIDDSVWNVTVVVVYRRIHEWLVSWYNQINKTTNHDSNGKVLLDKHGNPFREEHKHWPDRGGVRIPTFSAWYTNFTRNWDDSDFVKKHRSIEFHDLYTPLFDNVKVYDMHQKGDLATNFMCNIVPQADHCCLKLQNHQIQPPTVNPSVDLDHDILSVYAYDQGYVKKSLSRQEVVAAVTKYIKESQKIIPRACNPGISKQIYDWLVASERAMFANSWTPKRIDEMNHSFESYFVKGKLCDVDVEEAMKDQEWVDFFQSLGE